MQEVRRNQAGCCWSFRLVAPAQVFSPTLLRDLSSVGARCYAQNPQRLGEVSVSFRKPPALKPGDTVGIISPAAAIDREFLERGMNVVRELCFEVKVSAHALSRDRIFAGQDRHRTAELHKFFADPEVQAIFCARGGYGCGRILPQVNFEQIPRAPKIFLGFSDETFLLNAFVERSRMVCFHGPMVAMDMAHGVPQRSLDHMLQLLTGELKNRELAATDVVHPGTAEGILAGGCLSVLAAMIGTPFAPDLGGKVLFLEDTGEKPYRVDRLLVQMKQSGALAKAAAIVVGGMRGVEGTPQENALMRDFVAEQTADLGVPVLAGLEIGHRTENLTIPLGIRARVDGGARKLIFLESAVA